MRKKPKQKAQITVQPIPTLSPEEALQELAEIILAAYLHEHPLPKIEGTLGFTKPHEEKPPDAD